MRRSPEEILIHLSIAMRLPPDLTAQYLMELMEEVENPDWNSDVNGWKKFIPEYVRSLWDKMPVIGRISCWAVAKEALNRELA